MMNENEMDKEYEEFMEQLKKCILFRSYNPSPAKAILWERILSKPSNQCLLENVMYNDFLKKQSEWDDFAGRPMRSKVILIHDHTLASETANVIDYLTELGFAVTVVSNKDHSWHNQEYDFILEFVEAFPDIKSGTYRYLFVLYDRKVYVYSWIELRGMGI